MCIDKQLAFAKEHKGEDPLELLLQKSRHPEIDMAFVAQQLEGQRQALDKWPMLALCDNLAYPPRLNREQSSSEATARYKSKLIERLFPEKEHISIADLTAGMGIDSIFFAYCLGPRVEINCYERDSKMCKLLVWNIKALGLKNISVHNGDSIECMRQSDEHYDLIFIDPARRDGMGRKVSAFDDCTPNLLEHKELLSVHCNRLMVKASPMMDIDNGTLQIDNVSDIYVVALKGECKELLFVTGTEVEEPVIHSINLMSATDNPNPISFTRSEEAKAEATYCNTIKKYLYEPNASLMKGGPYKLLSTRWGVEKLSRNTHLYTSDNLLDWPGRIFRVEEEITLNKKTIASTLPEKKAHVVVRNYPTDAAALQKQLGLKEGGTQYVIATTIGIRKTGFICSEEKIINNF